MSVRVDGGPCDESVHVPGWIGGPEGSWLRFRKRIEGGPGELDIAMTASAWYALWVNGSLIGHGPPRGYHHRYFVNHWKVRTSANMQEIVALVFSPEEPAMAFVASPSAMLWAQVELTRTDGGRLTAVSDATWEVRVAGGYSPDAPRFSIQQTVEEHFDAIVSDGPWGKAQLRNVHWTLARYPLAEPHLVRKSPVRSWRLSVPRAEARVASYPLSSVLGPVGREPVDPLRRGAAGVTTLKASHPCRIRLDWLPFRTDRRVFLNGQEVPWRDTACLLDLGAGANRLVFDLTHKGPFDPLEWAYRLTFEDGCRAATQVTDEVLAGLEAGTLDPDLERLSRGNSLNKPVTFWNPGPGEGRTDVTLSELGSEVRMNVLSGGGLPVTQLPEVLRPGERILFDLGELMTGYVGLRWFVPEGATLHIRLFEAVSNGLPVNMAPYRSSLRVRVGRGAGEYVSPLRRGGRYVEITHAAGSDSAELRDVFLLREERLGEAVGWCAGEDPLVGRLFEVARRTLALATADAFVDCPSFEQVSWVGDMLAMALVNHRIWGNYGLTAHSLALARDSLDADSEDWTNPPPASARRMVSHAGSAIYDEIPAWSFLWVVAVRELYWDSGDLKVLGDLYGGVARVLDQAAGDLDSEGLYVRPDVWNFFDWTIDLPREGAIAINHALFARALTAAAEMASTLGRLDEAARWVGLRMRLLRVIERGFWSETEQGYRNVAGECGTTGGTLTLQTQLLMLWASAVPREKRAALAARMRDRGALGKARESPWYLFFHLWWLMEEGERGAALALLTEVWGSEVRRGAETFWEIFPSDHSPRRARSLAHGWSATPAYFLSRALLGVEPILPGYRSCRVGPYLPTDGRVSGAVPTPQGALVVEATRRKRRLFLTVAVPEGVEVCCEDPLQRDARVRLRHLASGDERETAATWGDGVFQAVFWTGGRPSQSVSTRA